MRDMRPHLCVTLCLMLTSQCVAFYLAPTLDPSLVSSTHSAVADEVTKVPVLGGRRVDNRRRLNASERGYAYRRQQMTRGRSLQIFSGVGSIAAPPPPIQVRGREGEIACKGGGLLSCNRWAHQKWFITPTCTNILPSTCRRNTRCKLNLFLFVPPFGDAVCRGCGFQKGCNSFADVCIYWGRWEGKRVS